MKIVIRDAAAVVTMNPAMPRIDGGYVVVDGTTIEAVGSEPAPTAPGASIMDASGQVVLPGLVNTHHHLYQTLTRAVPSVQDAELFDWLKRLYPIWAKIGDRKSVV